MKLFMATEFLDMSLTVKIVSDDGSVIALKGQRCNDHMPIYGCKLDDGEGQRLIDWVSSLPSGGESLEASTEPA